MGDMQCNSTSCDKSSCEGCPSKSAKPAFEMLNASSSIKNIVAVVSGKGGVGKSFITASIATELVVKGYKVGILDADITGPSIPKMFGIKKKALADENGLMPAQTQNGIKVMSVNLLLVNDETPVLWRGPIIANVVKQFWTDVVWGELDYLIIDMPPGTGDVPLTVFQSIPVDGIVIATAPQDLVKMIVKKAYNMAEQMNIPVLGMIENYSYLECPDCGKKINVFGKSKIDETAGEMGVKVLGKLPIIPEMAEKADDGQFGSIKNPYINDAIDIIENMGK